MAYLLLNSAGVSNMRDVIVTLQIIGTTSLFFEFSMCFDSKTVFATRNVENSKFRLNRRCRFLFTFLFGI